MNAPLPQTAPQPGRRTDVSTPPALQEPQQRRRPRRLLWHLLTAICAVQAALSLTLVWSNTAFGDEADYLWVGAPGMGALAARDLVAISLC